MSKSLRKSAFIVLSLLAAQLVTSATSAVTSVDAPPPIPTPRVLVEQLRDVIDKVHNYKAILLEELIIKQALIADSSGADVTFREFSTRSDVRPPERVRALMRMAGALGRAGKDLASEAALKQAREIADLDHVPRTRYESFINLASGLAEMARYGGAKQAFVEALNATELLPHDGVPSREGKAQEVLVRQAEFMLLIGDRGDARKVVQEAMKRARGVRIDRGRWHYVMELIPYQILLGSRITAEQAFAESEGFLDAALKEMPQNERSYLSSKWEFVKARTLCKSAIANKKANAYWAGERDLDRMLSLASGITHEFESAIWGQVMIAAAVLGREDIVLRSAHASLGSNSFNLDVLAEVLKELVLQRRTAIAFDISHGRERVLARVLEEAGDDMRALEIVRSLDLNDLSSDEIRSVFRLRSRFEGAQVVLPMINSFKNEWTRAWALVGVLDVVVDGA